MLSKCKKVIKSKQTISPSVLSNLFCHQFFSPMFAQEAVTSLRFLTACVLMLFPVPASECGGGPDALTVLLPVVGSILLVGLVLLAAWKLVITIHDRREFARFQSARSRARYEMVKISLTDMYYRPSVCVLATEAHSLRMESFNSLYIYIQASSTM